MKKLNRFLLALEAQEPGVSQSYRNFSMFLVLKLIYEKNAFVFNIETI